MFTYDIFKIIIVIIFTYIIYLRISIWPISFYKKFIIGIMYLIIFSYFTRKISLYIIDPFKSILIILLSGIFIMFVTRKIFKNVIIDIIISYTLSHIFYLISSIVSAIIFIVIYLIQGKNIEKIALKDNNVFYSVLWKTTSLSLIIETIIILIIMKLKINISESQKKLVGNIGIALSGIVILFYSFSRKETLSNEDLIVIITGIILCGLGLIYCFKKETIITYNEKVSEVTIKRLKQEIQETQNTNDYLENIAHKDAKRLPAYRKAVEEFINNSTDEDAKNKAISLLNELKEAEQEQARQTLKKLQKRKTLPSTGMILIDALFSHMLEKASQKNIDFDLIIGNTLNEITQVITQSQLETLSADLIENAIIAADYTNAEFKRILVYLWVSNGKYELRVDDNGIPFELNTLAHLGRRRITTHSDSGGSGIGFMTIFDIISKCSASIIITEIPPGDYAYSKSIVIRFDGEGERLIYSYRADQIINICNDGSWIIRDYFNETDSILNSV